MASVLVIAARRGFDDRAFTRLQAQLAARGIDVVLAGDAPRLIGERSLQRPPDVRLDRARLADHAALIVLGGFGAREHLWGNRPAMQLVAGAVLEHKPVVCLGLAAPLAAQTELLVDRDCACEPEEEALAELAKHHARYVDVPVVESEQGLITARAEGLDEAIHLLCDRLQLRPAAQP